jgi:hypothetical protein
VPGGGELWKWGPTIVQPAYFAAISRAASIACSPRASSSRTTGALASAGANESVERPVRSSTEMKTRSGREVNRIALSSVFKYLLVQRLVRENEVECC